MSTKVQGKDRKYKDLSAKQKGRIAEKTYRAYLSFYLEHGRMPDDEEAISIHRKLFQSVTALAPNALYEEFEEICQSRAVRYLDRIPADINRGVTLESLHKPKRTPAEKAAIQKAKNEARRKRRKKKKLEATRTVEMEQDDMFFFIAGYTSGGAPYGVTWEQMGIDYDEAN